MKNRIHSKFQALLPSFSSIKTCFSLPALALSAALSWSSSADAATETFNTPGTVNWICPPGVTSIQVECWGGGGAGGSGNKAVNTGTNTSQNGGGGGGGAYARRATVPVTPGLSYTITIPNAAVSETTTTNNTASPSGGTVTFVGDSGVTVTAAGGTGGRNAYTTANSTIAVGGGAGGTTAASVGDVGAVFAGGAGSASNTGSTNVSGSGGGGAGNANPGSAGVITTSTTTPGAGGIAGGGDGGAGRTGGNTNEGEGAPGQTPGGGGGGGKNQGVGNWLGGTGGLGQIVITYEDPSIVKADNTDNLNLTTSWVGGVVPTTADRAQWDSTVTSANTTVLGGDLTFGGIVITNPAGPVTVNAGNTLTLGSAITDINMSAATQDLTLNCDLALGASNVWEVASGRTLALGGSVSGTSGVTLQGAGAALMSGDSTYTGDTFVNVGALSLTGSLTGNSTTTAGSRLWLGTSPGNTVMNITGDIDSYLSFNGGSTSGANTAINMSSGTLNFTYTGGGNTFNQVNSAATGSYGSLNLTGGTINTVGRTMISAGAGGGSAYIGGTGTLNATGEWFMVTHVNANALGSLTIGPGGTLNRSGAASPLGIFLTAAGQYGMLNLTGGNLIISAPSQTTGIRFGNGNGGNNNTGILNLAAGTYETNANIHQSVGTSTGQFVDINLAGGTLKATGDLTSALPNSVTGQTVTTTVYGPVDNNGTAQDFTGGLTVDTNGNSVTLGNPMVAPSADGVARSSLAITGGSGYIGAPVVQFTGGTLATGGSPAAGYAVVSGGQVSDIVITAPGSYTSAPTVTLTGGGGSDASVTVGTLVANASGGLTKVGTGDLTLSGANTYAGTTAVSAGTLKLSTAGTSVSDVVVATGAAAGPLVAVDNGQHISTGDLTLGNNSYLGIDYGATVPSTTQAPIVVDNFNVGTGIGLIMEGSFVPNLAVGQAYPLVTWTTSGPANGSAFTGLILPYRLFGTFSVSANTLYFTVTSNSVGAISWNTGNGVWDTATSNWVDVGSVSTTYVDTLDEVLFGDASGASGNPVVSLNTSLSPVSVRMNSTGHDYKISGPGAIAGSAGLTLDAANTRTLTLVNDNTYTGATAVGGGTLSLGDGGTGGSLSTASAVNVLSGATLAVNQSDTVTQGTEFSGAALTGAGNFSQLGSGTTVLNAVNTYTGTTSISNGTLRIGGAGQLGSGTYAGNITISGGSLHFNSSATQTLSGIIDGGGTLTVDGNLTLSGANTYTGVTNVNSGSLTIANASALGTTDGNTVVASGARVFAGGAMASQTVPEAFTISGNGIDANSGAIHFGGSVTGVNMSGAVTLAGDATLKNDGSTSTTFSGGINLGSNTLTFAVGGGATNAITGGITGSGSVVKDSLTGNLNINSATSYTGTTTINAGILQLGAVDALSGNNPGVNGTSGITLATGTTLRATTNGTTVYAPITTSGSVTIGAPTVALGTQAWNEFILNGAIGGTADVTFNNTNNINQIFTVTLGAAGTYSGNTLITNTAGTAGQIVVRLGADDALPTTTIVTIDGNTGAGTGRGAEINLSGFDQTLAGLTNVTRSLRVQRVVNSDVSAAATLTINGPTDTTFTGILGGGANFSTNATANPGSTNGNNFGLTKDGAGTFALNPVAQGSFTGNNTYLGATRILGGILSLDNSLAMSQSPLDTLNSVAGDATNGLRTTVTTLTLGGLTGNKNLASVFTTTSGGYDGVTELTLNPVSGATLSYTGVIADGAAGMSLTKTGAGTQTLAGVNTYTGATSINAGTLALGANGVIPDASPVSLGAATLDAATFTDAAGALDVTGAATINLGAGAALAFADSSAVDWTGGTLAITGTFVSGSSLRFGTTSGGLTVEQLALITINGFTGVGIDANGFLTATAVGGYSVWASTNAGGQTADLDFDNDGVDNGVEYFMNAAAGFTANPQLNGSNSITWPNGGNIPASAYGTQFVVQTSNNLLNWTDVPVEALTLNTDGPGGSLTYTLTGTAPRFVRLVVTPN